MELQDESSSMRGPVVQTLIALGIILAAFRVADVAPLRAEPRVPAAEATYLGPLRALDDALARNDASGAARAWQETYTASLAGSGWEGLAAAGDAARRIGETFGTRAPAGSKARSAYLTAFFRARQQGAVPGMLRLADAFAALGDHEVAERCRRAAVELGARQDLRAEQELASRSAARWRRTP